MKFTQIISFIRALMCKEFIELAKHSDYVQVFDDQGDFVIIVGRMEKNPHDLAKKCVYVLQRITPLNGILSEDNGRTVLTFFIERRGRKNE